MRQLSLTLVIFTAALFSSATNGDDTAKRSAELQVLESCGHCPNIERADETNRLLLDFFTRMDNAR